MECVGLYCTGERRQLCDCSFELSVGKQLNYRAEGRERSVGPADASLRHFGVVAVRFSPTLRAMFTEGLEAHLDMLKSIMPETAGGSNRERARAAMTMMAGALILLRSAEEKASRQILKAAPANMSALVHAESGGGTSKK